MKSAYEMRISVWSSDVFSSDLAYRETENHRNQGNQHAKQQAARGFAVAWNQYVPYEDGGNQPAQAKHRALGLQPMRRNPAHAQSNHQHHRQRPEGMARRP